MEKQDIRFRIKETCDERTPDVLNSIKNSSEFRVPVKNKKSLLDYFSLKSFSYSLASVFVIALLITLVMTSQPSTPVIASTITVDINPSIEITLDEDDNVINVVAINDDGEEIINPNTTFRGLSLDQAIEILIEEAYDQGFIVDTTEENVVLISVDSDNSELRERLETQLETKIAAEVVKYSALVRVIKERNPDVTNEQLENLVTIARNNKITIAKLSLINKIIILDDSYTLFNLKDQSIKDLYILHYSLLSPIENITDIEPDEVQDLIDDAQEHQITVAKLLLINKILELEEAYTLEDLKDLTVRELNGIHYKLLNTETTEDDNPGNNDDPGNSDDPGNGN